MTSTVVIRHIRPDDGPALRATRLRAIGDAPKAFAVSLAETKAETDEGWTAWATLSSAGHTHVMYVAEDGGKWIGMAGGMLDTSRPGAGELISMWVDPTYRGQGVGQRLVAQIAHWTRLRGLSCLELWVTENNRSAIALYERCGFKKTDESKLLPSDPRLMERRMVLDL